MSSLIASVLIVIHLEWTNDYCYLREICLLKILQIILLQKYGNDTNSDTTSPQLMRD